MKKLLYLLVTLCTTQSFAQYFHTQYTETGIPATILTRTVTVPLADGNICFATTEYDSLFRITKINAASGAVIRTRNFIGKGSNPLPDSVSYSYNTNFFPTRDTGLAVVFSQSNYHFPASSTDSAQVVIIKLDKLLQVQWALSRHYSTAGSDWFYVPAIASDTNGNTVLSYSIGSTFGICKIDPAGNIAADKQSAGELAFRLYAVGIGRYLGVAGRTNYFSGNSELTTAVLDNQLNIIRYRRYTINDLVDVSGDLSTPRSNYNQLLIGGSAFQYIPQGGSAFSALQNTYYVTDTAGRLLFVKNAPTTTGNAPTQNLSVLPDNKICISGYESVPYLTVTDTTGNTLQTKDLSSSGLYPFGALVPAGNDLLFGAATYSAQGVQLHTNLVRYRNDGYLFCPGANAATTPSFSNLPIIGVTTAIPTLAAGTLSMSPTHIDTAAPPQVTYNTLCTTSAGINQAIEKQASSLAYTGNYTVQTTLPAGIRTGTLIVTDISGRGILKQELHSNRETVQLPQIPAGVYTWQLYYNGEMGYRRNTGKIAVQ